MPTRIHVSDWSSATRLIDDLREVLGVIVRHGPDDYELIAETGASDELVLDVVRRWCNRTGAEATVKVDGHVYRVKPDEPTRRTA